MTEQAEPRKNPWLAARIAIRFVIFGAGGFITLWVGCVSLILDLMSRKDPSSLLGYPVTLAGGLMMLFGSGLWGRWVYLWVFYSIPIVVGIIAVLSHYLPRWDEYVPLGKGFVPFLPPMPVSYWLVQRYYKWREAALPSTAPARQITNNQEVY